MNFLELFDASRFPKLSTKGVNKPKYQISSDEYNALASAIKTLMESQSESYHVAFEIETAAIINTSNTSPEFVFTPRFYVTRGGEKEYQSSVIDYTIYASVNGGNQQTVATGEASTDIKKRIPIRSYLSAGNSTIFSIVAKERDTETMARISYEVTYTSISLDVANYQWYKAWKQSDTSFTLGAIGIKGAANKQLHVVVNVGSYSKEYVKNIGTAVGNSFSIGASDGLVFPTFVGGAATGTVEMWLSSSNVEIDHIVLPLMVVKSTAATSAKLVAVNRVASTLVNDAQNVVFNYAFYYGGASSGKVTASVNGVADTYYADTETSLEYSSSISLDVESDYYVPCSLECGTSKVEYSILLDNSASYPATIGSIFYMNPANRNNGQENATTIINQVGQQSISAAWTKMVFDGESDGWVTDTETGRKALCVPARSRCDISYTPFANGVGTGIGIELLYKVKNVSNYKESVISICDNPNIETFRGIRIKPNSVQFNSMMANAANSARKRSYDLMDEEVVHVFIDFNPNYNGTEGCATIYVNGIKKVVMAYSNTDSWKQSGHIILGADSSDLMVYGIRVYGQSLGFASVLSNFVSSRATQSEKASVHTEINSIMDGDEISFDKVKENYNVFTVEMLTGSQSSYHEDLGTMPTYGHEKSYAATCNMEMFFADGYGFKLNDTLIEGQGTTSMNYWLWNMRWRIDKNSATSSHAAKECASVQYLVNGSWVTDSQKKSVKFFRDGVSNLRITAKKNYASSSQGHKMGTTAAFNDLHDAVVGANEAGGRVAVKQVPAYGFLKVQSEDGGYIYYYIGQYTIGADKGDKPTFGWSGDYKSKLISMEGTDHDPKLTNFAYPWTSDVTINGAYLAIKTSEADCQNGWEIGNILGLETDNTKSAYNANSIISAVNDHWKPAYMVAYNNSTRILPVPDGMTIDSINADVNAFQNSVDSDGNPYKYYQVWDDNYDLYYYDIRTNKYTKGINLLTDLGVESVSGSTKSEQNEAIKSLRRVRFISQWTQYWHKEDTLFNNTFQLIFAASDNFAKNTYPYNLDPAGGLKWRWVNDDLDTILPTDNQGLDTKTYSIEWNDFTDEQKTAYVFKGIQSTFWTLVNECYETEIKAMGKSILEQMASMASQTGRGISRFGSGNIGRLMQFFYDYYWDKTADTFKRSSYNLDMELSYEEAYKHYGKGYDPDVNPLEQERGDHEEAEIQWVYRRMVYVMSKFGMGAFADYADTTLGRITMRTQTPQTFTLVPAIDMYPSLFVGASSVMRSSARVMAGDSVTLTGGGDNSNVYIPASDWMTEIGDLCGIKVDSNSNIIIGGKRLKKIKLGDVTASKVTSVLGGINIGDSPCLETIDARNLASLNTEVSLASCPRLKEAYFEGTNIPSITVPEGAKLETLHLPASLLNLSLKKMWHLEDFSLSGSSCMSTVYLNRCSGSVYSNIIESLKSQFIDVSLVSGKSYVLCEDGSLFDSYEMWERYGSPSVIGSVAYYNGDALFLYKTKTIVENRTIGYYSKDLDNGFSLRVISNEELLLFSYCIESYMSFNTKFGLFVFDTSYDNGRTATRNFDSDWNCYRSMGISSPGVLGNSGVLNMEEGSKSYALLTCPYNKTNNIQSVTMLFGGENNPTELTTLALTVLIDMLKNKTIEKNINGYVSLKDGGKICKSEKEMLIENGVVYVGDIKPDVVDLSVCRAAIVDTDGNMYQTVDDWEFWGSPTVKGIAVYREGYSFVMTECLKLYTSVPEGWRTDKNNRGSYNDYTLLGWNDIEAIVALKNKIEPLLTILPTGNGLKIIYTHGPYCGTMYVKYSSTYRVNEYYFMSTKTGYTTTITNRHDGSKMYFMIGEAL